MKAQVFEEHSSVLPHWWGQGLRGVSVVVLDAHLDFQHVHPPRIDRLRQCPDAHHMRRLEQQDPFAVMAEACFGIEDLLFPASRLGIIGRIVWVAPPHVLRHGFGPALQRLVQVEGIAVEDIQSLTVTADGVIDGTLAGTPITVCTLDRLHRAHLAAGWLLDVDLDYFVALPGDRLWADPIDTLDRLRGMPGAPEELTISRSVRSGFTPVQMSGLADRMASAWRSPSSRDSPADDPVPAPEETDAAPGEVFLEMSAAHSRRLPLSGGRLDRWHHQLASAADPSPTAGPSWVVLGLLHCTLGRWDLACEAFEQAHRRGHPHPELALEIARGMRHEGWAERAQAYADRAVTDPATRVRALEVQFSLACAAGQADLAVHWAGTESEATPANPAALDRLAMALAAAGDAGLARQAAERAQALRLQLADAGGRLAPLARRLSG